MKDTDLPDHTHHALANPTPPNASTRHLLRRWVMTFALGWIIVGSLAGCVMQLGGLLDMPGMTERLGLPHSPILYFDKSKAVVWVHSALVLAVLALWKSTAILLYRAEGEARKSRTRYLFAVSVFVLTVVLGLLLFAYIDILRDESLTHDNLGRDVRVDTWLTGTFASLLLLRWRGGKSHPAMPAASQTTSPEAPR